MGGAVDEVERVFALDDVLVQADAFAAGRRAGPERDVFVGLAVEIDEEVA